MTSLCCETANEVASFPCAIDLLSTDATNACGALVDFVFSNQIKENATKTENARQLGNGDDRRRRRVTASRATAKRREKKRNAAAWR